MSTILIIEDDPFVLRFYDRLFSEAKFTVHTAKNGEEGIKLAHELKPTLIFLDIMMPGMNGLAVLQQLKIDEETKSIDVVMLTNFGEEELVRRAMSMGASGIMVKSEYTPEKLIEAIEKKAE